MAKTSLELLFLFVCCVAAKDAIDFRCDYNYYEEIDAWLKIHIIPAQWHEARLRCHLEGAVLASPLTTKLHKTLMTAMDTSHMWTGVHATFSNGDYHSIEGVPLNKLSIDWSSGQPDNVNGSEECLVMFNDGKVNDISCANAFRYACYKENDTSVVQTNCGTVDRRYKLHQETGSCYKFHTVPRTWSRAYETCNAEGGYLTIINSKVEAEVIKKIYSMHTDSKMVGNYDKQYAFVGFHDWGEHFTWLTIQGQTLAEAGFDKFGPFEPNNSQGNEHCGAVFRSGLLNDLACNAVHAFICEKDPKSNCDPAY